VPHDGSFRHPGPEPDGGQRPGRLLIPPGERRAGLSDVSVSVGDQEIAVGDANSPGPRTDEDVDPVVVLPEPPDLDPLQVAGPAKGVQDVLADDGVQVLALLVLLTCVLLNLLFRWHRLFQILIWECWVGVPHHRRRGDSLSLTGSSTNATPRPPHPPRRLPAGSGREKACGGLAGCPLVRGRPCSPGPWR